MNLIINSDEVLVDDAVSTVADLLSYFELDQKVAIVELNRVILEKSKHADARLANGDVVEIVHFVGGG
ncbi:sulfur carrier protein ThiS [Rossellomorea vietnamensis]|uniref:Sulfur carrier protein ThiS n=1 Tax=Rossellomorea vietnamensis TaxID=218284 RepID=A0A5D4NIF4_9BACI|nr:sulfur carrier protein ThiS [Rossellomorea vietnamensis]TYS13534.1 sulfur carrier protein ThiS [Rossellomorea vietnamensis]